MLAELYRLGGRASVEGEQVKITAPRGAVPDGLRAALRAHRDDVRTLLVANAEPDVTKPLLAAMPRPARLPLSFAQQRLWVLDRLEGASTEYNAPVALRLRGPLDADALQRALDTIVARHETLRTRFDDADGEPVQIVEPPRAVPLPVEDLRSMSPAAQRGRLLVALDEQWTEPFDLSRGPLLRVRLLQLAAEDHVLLRTLHHIVSDGWSQAVFNRELMALYEAFRAGGPMPLSPLPLQYADFALWQRRWLASGGLADGLAYWKKQLADVPDRLPLPADRPRPAVQTFNGDVHQAPIAPEIAAAVERMMRESRTTLYMVTLAGFAILLARYSGQEDVVVGSPVANRLDERLEPLIGFFVNSLVMRVRVDSRQTFRSLLAEVQTIALDAYRYQETPFERVVEALAPERSLDSTPLYQIGFAVQNAPSARMALDGLAVEAIGGETRQVRFDIEVNVREGRGLTVTWLYNRDLFDAWRIAQMARHYERLLAAAVADPDRPTWELDLLDASERTRILHDWNATSVEIPAPTVLSLFDQQAARTPDAVAVQHDDVSASYAGLRERSAALAAALVARGAGPERCVAVSMPRSSDLVVALLAVLRSGAAYLPLEPDHPADRLASLLDDAQPICIVVTTATAARMPPQADLLIVDGLDLPVDAAAATNHPPRVDAAAVPRPDDLAYVMFTSGSSGVPKPVAVTHRALVSKIWTLARFLGVNLATRFGASTSLSFDPLIEQILVPLCAGAMTIPVAEAVRSDVDLFRSFVRRHRLTVFNATPSLTQVLAGGLDRDGLDVLIAGGELLPSRLAGQWRTNGVARRILNFYGPTEACVDATAFAIDAPIESASTPIGRPLPNYRVYVLDAHLEPAPIGVPGELYIAGPGLARGYRGQPSATAARFVADLHGASGERMYRTGDLARWRSDGVLEFLGRTDDQVKIRGVRIEPGEIADVLSADPSVAQAYVTALDDPNRDVKRLIAYVVGRPGLRVSPAEIQQRAALRLPDYMMPAHVVVLDRLPTTAQGKVDVRALPPPPAPSSGSRHPQTVQEEILCRTIGELLRLPAVAPSDNFFTLGGDSIVAIQLASRCRKEGLTITPRDVFRWQTIEAIARAASNGDSAAAPADASSLDELRAKLRSGESLDPDAAVQLIARLEQARARAAAR